MTELETQTYDLHAAQEILRYAGAQRKKLDYFTTEDLVRAAAELDIPASAVRQAEQLVKERLSEEEDRQEFRRDRARTAAVSLGVFAPLVVVLCLAHFIHFIGNAFTYIFSSGKTFINSATALFFGKATRHEIEFHQWRSKRYQIAEFGTSNTVTLARRFVTERGTPSRSEVIQWLREQGVAEEQAAKAVTKLAEERAYRFLSPFRVSSY